MKEFFVKLCLELQDSKSFFVSATFSYDTIHAKLKMTLALCICNRRNEDEGDTHIQYHYC
jgi:hypothetical protein